MYAIILPPATVNESNTPVMYNNGSCSYVLDHLKCLFTANRRPAHDDVECKQRTKYVQSHILIFFLKSKAIVKAVRIKIKSNETTLRISFYTENMKKCDVILEWFHHKEMSAYKSETACQYKAVQSEEHSTMQYNLLSGCLVLHLYDGANFFLIRKYKTKINKGGKCIPQTSVSEC